MKVFGAANHTRESYPESYLRIIPPNHTSSQTFPSGHGLNGNSHVYFCMFFFVRLGGNRIFPRFCFMASQPPPPPRPRNATYTVHCHVIPFPVRLVAMVVGPFKGMCVCFRALYTTCQKTPFNKITGIASII